MPEEKIYFQLSQLAIQQTKHYLILHPDEYPSFQRLAVAFAVLYAPGCPYCYELSRPTFAEHINMLDYIERMIRAPWCTECAHRIQKIFIKLGSRYREGIDYFILAPHRKFDWNIKPNTK